MRGPQMLLIALFAVASAGVGLYYVGRSNAASEGCVLNDYSAALSGRYILCVKSLQTVLDNWQWADYAEIQANLQFNPFLVPDGYYASLTTAGVKDFQRWNNQQASIYSYLRPHPPYPNLTVDGIAGPETWHDLCWWGSDKVPSGYYVNHYKLDDAGCLQYFGLQP